MKKLTTNGTVVLGDGIPHLELLPCDKFIDVVTRLHTYQATEKIDGANLVVGIDPNGRLYTTRETKGGIRFYSIEDFSPCPANNGFCGAHAALEKVRDVIADTIRPGDAIEIEVLYGPQPNVIPYGNNHIVFLRMIPGDSNTIPSQELLTDLCLKLPSQTTVKDILTTTSQDGKHLHSKVQSQQWFFSGPVNVVIDPVNEQIQELLTQFKTWLDAKNDFASTNREAINLNLTKIPKGKRDIAKIARANASAYAIQTYKKPIKELLLNQYNRKMKSNLTSQRSEDQYEGIEGIVFLNPESLEQFKLVDVEMFTKCDAFYHTVRNRLKATSHISPVFDPFNLEIDVYTTMLSRFANCTQLKGTERIYTVKRALSKFKSDTLNCTSAAIADAISNNRSDFNTLKADLIDVCKDTIDLLDACLDQFIHNVHTYEYVLPTGKIIKYNQHVKDRTLTYFAEIREEIVSIKLNLLKSHTYPDIVNVLYRKQLQALHINA